jgi:hypothetical protein
VGNWPALIWAISRQSFTPPESRDPEAFERSTMKRLPNFLTYSKYQDCLAVGMRAAVLRLLPVIAE